MLISRPPDDDVWFEPGVAALYDPPFPELDGMQSVQAAAAWLDRSVAHAQREETITLDRPALRHTSADLELVEDDETGVVLFTAAVGLRGPLSLQVASQRWVTREPALFTHGDHCVW